MMLAIVNVYDGFYCPRRRDSNDRNENRWSIKRSLPVFERNCAGAMRADDGSFQLDTSPVLIDPMPRNSIRHPDISMLDSCIRSLLSPPEMQMIPASSLKNPVLVYVHLLVTCCSAVHNLALMSPCGSNCWTVPRTTCDRHRRDRHGVRLTSSHGDSSRRLSDSFVVLAERTPVVHHRWSECRILRSIASIDPDWNVTRRHWKHRGVSQTLGCRHRSFRSFSERDLWFPEWSDR